MTTVDLLKRGLTNHCWSDITEAYKGLTGVVIHVDDAGGSVPSDTIDELIEVRNKISEIIDEVRVSIFVNEVEPVKNKSKEPAKKSGRPKKNPSVEKPVEHIQQQPQQPVFPKVWNPNGLPCNNFVDDGSIAPELIKETKQSIKKRGPKRKDQRDEIRYVDVNCDRCKKSEQVHPDLAPTRLDPTSREMTKYVCNSCLGGR